MSVSTVASAWGRIATQAGEIRLMVTKLNRDEHDHAQLHPEEPLVEKLIKRGITADSSLDELVRALRQVDAGSNMKLLVAEDVKDYMWALRANPVIHATHFRMHECDRFSLLGAFTRSVMAKITLRNLYDNPLYNTPRAQNLPHPEMLTRLAKKMRHVQARVETPRMRALKAYRDSDVSCLGDRDVSTTTRRVLDACAQSARIVSRLATRIEAFEHARAQAIDVDAPTHIRFFHACKEMIDKSRSDLSNDALLKHAADQFVDWMGDIAWKRYQHWCERKVTQLAQIAGTRENPHALLSRYISNVVPPSPEVPAVTSPAVYAAHARMVIHNLLEWMQTEMPRATGERYTGLVQALAWDVRDTTPKIYPTVMRMQLEQMLEPYVERAVIILQRGVCENINITHRRMQEIRQVEMGAEYRAGGYDEYIQLAKDKLKPTEIRRSKIPDSSELRAVLMRWPRDIHTIGIRAPADRLEFDVYSGETAHALLDDYAGQFDEALAALSDQPIHIPRPQFAVPPLPDTLFTDWIVHKSRWATLVQLSHPVATTPCPDDADVRDHAFIVAHRTTTAPVTMRTAHEFVCKLVLCIR